VNTPDDDRFNVPGRLINRCAGADGPLYADQLPKFGTPVDDLPKCAVSQPEAPPTLTIARLKNAVMLYTSRSKRSILITETEALRMIRLLQNAVAGKPGHHGKVSVTYSEPID